VDKRFQACFAARDWDAMAEMLSEGFSVEDRRRVVNAGNLHGRDAELTVHAYAAVGSENVTSTVIATRAQRLALSHYRFSGGDQRPDAFRIEMLVVVEIDADDRMAAVVVFDADDIDAAIAELDARYLVGEAAGHAHTWSVIAGAYAAFNRHEFPEADWVTVDNRRATPFASSTMTASLRAMWDLTPDLNIHIETVYRLNTFGAVLSHTGSGTSPEGFDAEWRAIDILTVEGDRITRCEVFDEDELDTALARFDRLSRPAPRLENAAGQVADRFMAHFAAGDWDAMAEILADNLSNEDRRRVVSTGVFDGRDAQMANARAIAELWSTNVTRTVMATRGRNLSLARVTFSRGEGVEAFVTEFLAAIEIDADERISAIIVFDVEDFDAAIAELDAHYLAGGAAANAHMWSAIVGAYGAINRRELPPTTPDFEDEDHRRGAAFATGDMIEYLRAGWDLDQDISFYIEAVHRLSDLGAVVTHKGCGTSREGFDAEWREVMLFTADSDSFSRCEVFDEADLDAALARFDQLSQPAPRLENTATRVFERLYAHVAAGEWQAVTHITAEDVSVDDRRRVVNAGILHGRDANIKDAQATVDVGFTMTMLGVLATRGERLALTGIRVSGRDPEAIQNDALQIMEVDAKERIAGVVVFDLEDFDAAIAELDARYLAGEAAAHARTWSVIAGTYASVNHGEFPAHTPDCMTIDHRRVTAFAPGELNAYIRAGWELDQTIRTYVEVVHRLSDLGAVCTFAAYGVSHEGFDAEWRGISLSTVDGDMVNRSEFFDEDDLEVALATFDQLSRPAPQLENAATRTLDRVNAYFAARDWAALGTLMAADVVDEDRRRTANAGVRHGRDAIVGGVRTAADLGAQHMASTTIATRGDRLALCRFRYSGRDQRPEAFYSEALGVFEIDVDERVVAHVAFDLEAIDAAFEELDTRYLAGEAAAHPHTWALLGRLYAGLNRHELPPTTPDFVDVDNRRLAAFAPGDIKEFAGTAFDQIPDLSFRIEAVHRLSNLGAVVTQALRGTSREGFEAEWREIHLTMIDGDLFNRSEIFDDADLDAALARFEELSRPPTRLENAATRVAMRVWACFAASDWDSLAELFADDISTDDRRHVVNAGVFRGRDAQISNMRAITEFAADITSTVIATRGERLALNRISSSSAADFDFEALSIIEVGSDNRAVAGVQFDPDDMNAALEELDARYLAGEAAAHAHTWSVISQAYATLNRRALPATTPDWTSVDQRHFGTIEPNALTPNIRAFWDMMSEARINVATVHRLTKLGAVVAHATHATSQEGVEIESGEIIILMVDGDLLSRCEIFNEADLDAALARFEELHPQPPRLENPAIRVSEHLFASFAAGDWDSIREILANDFSQDDRRRVVGAGVRRGRDDEIADLRAIADLWSGNTTGTYLATRGERLDLMRLRFSLPVQGDEAFVTEVLGIGEINAEGRIVAAISFDPDDIDAAFEELDARYLAGEAAKHADTWSLVVAAYAAFNRHELPAVDWNTVDHRRASPFASSTMTESLRAIWDLTPALKIHIEAVHRLNSFGAVITHEGHGSSQEGFDAEWRAIDVLTVEGDRIIGCEIFDEADLDAALARFEELDGPARRLENTASHVAERFLAYFAASDWDAMAEILADNSFNDDRRRVVNAGIQYGRDAQMANMRIIAELFSTDGTATVVATRAARLVLVRLAFSDRGQGSNAFQIEVLGVVEIDTEDRITAFVAFDTNDFEGAIAEIDARYLAGEAAEHQRTWSAIAGMYTSFNRHELPATTPDWVTVDRRPGATFEFRDAREFFRSTWDLTPHASIYAEAVHRLTSLGAVVTHVVHGTSEDGFDAEWRQIGILTVEGDRINRCELFDETDLDAALARLDELCSQTRRLENAASQAAQRFFAYIEAQHWAAMADILADESFSDDRRRVVNAELWRGRDVVIAELRETTDYGVLIGIPDLIAIRGRCLALCRVRWSANDQGAEAFPSEALCVTEVDKDGQIAAIIMFDPDDLEGAFDELDARYLAGEAGAYAAIWSVIVRTYAAFNRHELPPTTPDWVNIDHRRGIAFEPGDATAYIRAPQDPHGSVYVESVQRLNNRGAVFTWVGHGTSQGGFEAEWRGINVATVEGDQINRGEIFDETDLDAALAKFEELHPQRPRLENPATQVEQRFLAYFAARNWAALAEILTDESFIDDRRPVVNAGLWDGRDAVITNLQAVADAAANITSVIATRGDRLALTRIHSSNRDPGQGDFGVEMLNIVEIDTDERIVAHVEFDPNDIDAAFAELDARYLAGEAAAHAEAWSVITRTYAAFNRHELSPTTPDWVNIDHRRGIAFAPGDMTAYIRAGENLTSDSRIYIETVDRLSHLGAVVTQVMKGTSRDGFDAEWREIGILTVEGDLISRGELFDEADLDTALARFEELDRLALLDNAATRSWARQADAFNRRDVDGFLALVTADGQFEDRRKGLRVVTEGPARRKAVQAVFEEAPSSWRMRAEPIAIRGSRLELSREYYVDTDEAGQPITVEFLHVMEVSPSGLVHDIVSFDPNDLDAAFEELDARYVSGEAAAHSRTWSVVSGAYASMNRHELFATTPDWVNVDHRRPKIIEQGGLNASLLSMWTLIPDVTFRVETVHRLTNVGAVCTHVAQGISQDGFDAEWRGVELLTVDGDLINRCEIFDGADLDTALARFDELRSRAPRLKNAVGGILERYRACFSAREWAAMSELLADDIVLDDRRRVVNAGVQRGREVHIADLRAAVEVGADTVSSSVVATRGERLALAHARAFNRGAPPGEVGAEWLVVAEIDSNGQIVAAVSFDLDDIDDAFEELDARYVAGEAAAHGQTWSLISRAYAAFNRHELPSTTPDWVNIDHRRGRAFAAGDLIPYIRATWDVTPQASIYIEAVHRLSNLGAVVTNAVNGTSQDGFDAEWREISILTFKGNLISRCELFDEADLDAALARFEELHPPTRRLENAASQVEQRFLAYFAARDWDAYAEILSDDVCMDDRRQVVNAGVRHGRDAEIASMRAIADVGVTRFTSNVIAIRGERLALGSYSVFDGWGGSTVLSVSEINAENQIVARVAFDPEDIDAAFVELDARYLAGEATDCAHAWSVIAESYAAFNRHELPAEDLVTVDRRRATPFESSTMTETLRSIWDLTPDLDIRIEAVHRLSSFGAVVTHVQHGTSTEGFDAEWRSIELLTIHADRVNYCEIFDEADLDTALARFDELHPEAARLENTASQAAERYLAHFAAGDWNAMAEMLADNYLSDDRRPVVGAGVRHGRDAQMSDMRAIAEVWLTNVSLTVIATRGERLILTRSVYSGHDQGPEAFHTEVLAVGEIDADERIAATVSFDPADIDAAFEELDARYLSGAAAVHADTWSVMMQACAALNTREIFATTADFVDIDHRSLAAIASGDLKAYIREALNDGVYIVYIEAVHRLGDLGAVVTLVSRGISQQGFDGEWRMADVFTVEGDLISSLEIFDEADLDAALARFDELDRPPAS
jgi:hypothetical protein